MPDTPPCRIPRYRRHKPTGLGLVRIQCRDFYLGKYGTPESRRAYERVIAEWLAGTRCLPAKPPGNTSGPGDATVNELFLAYWEFAESYYRKNGRATGEVQNIRDACRPLMELYGTTAAGDVGPRSLKAVRQKMMDSDLCRSVINARINRIRRMFTA